MWRVYQNENNGSWLVTSDPCTKHRVWKLTKTGETLQDVLTETQMAAYAAVRMLPNGVRVAGLGVRSGMFRDGAYIVVDDQPEEGEVP